MALGRHYRAVGHRFSVNRGAVDRRIILLLAIAWVTSAAACTAPRPRLTLTPSPTNLIVPLPQASETPSVEATACSGEGCPPTPTALPTAIPMNDDAPPSWKGTMTIWHAWEPEQVVVLEQIVHSFQQAYPDVYFNLAYIPPEALKDLFEKDVYLGKGPSILVGPAEWGPGWAEQGLVADLTPFFNEALKAAVSPPALGTCQYHSQWICLPYAQKGIVLYRNVDIIPEAPATFEELVTLAQAATRGGVVGADLERGIYHSAAHLEGLGGRLMDEAGFPAFNDDTGLEWVGLLRAFAEAGPVELNTDRDLRLFKESKAGMIVEGTWYLNELAQAIGAESLAIDPWPAYGSGHLSGFVWGESVYLNANLTGADQAAAMQFMGYLLAPEVQTLLAEVGFIPSRLDAQPRNSLIHQAAAALSAGASYPNLPADSPYWDLLSAALYSIFVQNTDPAAALHQSADNIRTRLRSP